MSANYRDEAYTYKDIITNGYRAQAVPRESSAPPLQPRNESLQKLSQLRRPIERMSLNRKSMDKKDMASYRLARPASVLGYSSDNKISYNDQKKIANYETVGRDDRYYFHDVKKVGKTIPKNGMVNDLDGKERIYFVNNNTIGNSNDVRSVHRSNEISNIDNTDVNVRRYLIDNKRYSTFDNRVSGIEQKTMDSHKRNTIAFDNRGKAIYNNNRVITTADDQKTIDYNSNYVRQKTSNGGQPPNNRTDNYYYAFVDGKRTYSHHRDIFTYDRRTIDEYNKSLEFEKMNLNSGTNQLDNKKHYGQDNRDNSSKKTVMVSRNIINESKSPSGIRSSKIEEPTFVRNRTRASMIDMKSSNISQNPTYRTSLYVTQNMKQNVTNSSKVSSENSAAENKYYDVVDNRKEVLQNNDSGISVDRKTQVSGNGNQVTDGKAPINYKSNTMNTTVKSSINDGKILTADHSKLVSNNIRNIQNPQISRRTSITSNTTLPVNYRHSSYDTQSLMGGNDRYGTYSSVNNIRTTASGLSGSLIQDNRMSVVPEVYGPLPYKSPRRYVESDVTIHYKCPVRQEPRPLVPEEELARRQADHMRRVYQEERRRKYLQELQDMNSRRHTDNFTPSQKSPISLNRYDSFGTRQVARALFNFVGQSTRELTFRKGDLILVRRQIDNNWFEGEHNSKVGLFPSNYVELIEYDSTSTPSQRRPSEGRARAKFNFAAQTHLELALRRGELVTLTRRVDDNWYEGRLGDRKGIFPVTYVEVLAEPTASRSTELSTPIVNSKPVASPAAHSVVGAAGVASLGSHHYTPQLNSPALSNSPSSTAPLTLPSHGITSHHARPASATLPRASDQTPVNLNNHEPLYVDTNAEAVPYRAMYKYRPQNPDELELAEGDTVYVLEKCDDGWYVGSSQRSGRFGTFPGNYVERI